MISRRWLIVGACLLLIAIALGYHFFFKSGHTVYQKISQQEAKDKMAQDDVVILDVRTAAEYQTGHIPNAVLLPVDTVKTQAESMLPDKEQTLLVYCRSGNRSATASKYLIALGYQNVFDFGGINTWPYEIVK